MDTRVFFVTDSRDANEEIFETQEDAFQHYINELMPGTNRRIRICKVWHSYREADGRWNYDDRSDTFETVALVLSEG